MLREVTDTAVGIRLFPTQARALLLENTAHLMGIKALLTESRAFFMENRALFTENRVFLVEHTAL